MRALTALVSAAVITLLALNLYVAVREPGIIHAIPEDVRSSETATDGGKLPTELEGRL